MAYTTIDKPSDYFNTLLYTGNGASSHAISGVGFQPDWTWNKNRSSAVNHALTDSVRGAPKRLMSQSNEAEINQTTGLLSFNSDGFTVGSDSGYNGDGNSMVSWNWKAGTSFTNDASSTSIGSIDSAGSINTTAGFSIIGFTGNANAGTTIAHGLGVKPNMIILKNREPDTSNWQVYHSSLGATHYVQLNSTGAAADSNTRWHDVEPTSSVFTTGSSGDVCGDSSGETFIAYCFAEKKGYSKFGNYTGNGQASDGTFVYLGFRPAIVITKKTDGADDWRIFDNKRSSSGFNPVDKHIYPYSSGAEASSSTNSVPDGFDFLSNGFKIRQASAGINADGGAYVYLAFAENPFVNSNGVPTNAR